MSVIHSHALLLLLGAAVGSSSQPGAISAQERVVEAAKGALIRRVLDLSKAADVTVSAMEAAIPSQRAANPQVPKEFWEEFATRARREAPRFLEVLIPIYDAQFTLAQLKQLVQFYEAPLGRHMVEVQPVIAVQSMRAGQQWGAQLGSQIAQDLARQGVRMRRP